jgi:hypothetical protein
MKGATRTCYLIRCLHQWGSIQGGLYGAEMIQPTLWTILVSLHIDRWQGRNRRSLPKPNANVTIFRLPLYAQSEQNDIRSDRLTPAQYVARVSQVPRLSSLTGFVGKWTASRLWELELRCLSQRHLICGATFAVAIICNFSKVTLGEELVIQCFWIYIINWNMWAQQDGTNCISESTKLSDGCVPPLRNRVQVLDSPP